MEIQEVCMERGYRYRCLREKEHRCVGCGVEDGLVVHHINGDRDDNRLENLIPVCRGCHSKIHTGNSLPDDLQEYQDELPPDSKNWMRRGSSSDSRKTTIEVHEETWKMLNRRKEPGQTFDEVIQELGAQVEA
jgi:hypothetical protein